MTKMLSSSLPMLKECCCGCSLKTGSMIIGFITLVSACILAFIAGSTLTHGNYSYVHQSSAFETALQIAVLAVRVLQAFCSFLLIIATHKDLALLVFPWLIIALVVVVVEGTSLTIMLSHLAVGELNPRVFSLSTHVSVTIYFFFVVYSYYRQVKSNPNASSKV